MSAADFRDVVLHDLAFSAHVECGMAISWSELAADRDGHVSRSDANKSSTWRLHCLAQVPRQSYVFGFG